MKNKNDGKLYATLDIYGKKFDIYYGYYEEYERSSEYGEPVPIYPDFLKNPVYTDDGRPFVTKMQPICKSGSSPFEEGLCGECPYFTEGEELIGICALPRESNDTTRNNEPGGKI